MTQPCSRCSCNVVTFTQPHAAYLTRTKEKKGSEWSEALSFKVTIRSLTFFRSDLERLVLSFSRAEMCCTLREEEKMRMLTHLL